MNLCRFPSYFSYAGVLRVSGYLSTALMGNAMDMIEAEEGAILHPPNRVPPIPVPQTLSLAQTADPIPLRRQRLLARILASFFPTSKIWRRGGTGSMSSPGTNPGLGPFSGPLIAKARSWRSLWW